MSNHPFDPEKSKLYNALIDAVNRSPHFSAIPLPAIIDNQLEELIQKFKYDQLPKEYHPTFDPPKEGDKKDEFPSILVDPKIKNKMKNLKKRIDKDPKSDKLKTIM
jgi:hypothetical protein